MPEAGADHSLQRGGDTVTDSALLFDLFPQQVQRAIDRLKAHEPPEGYWLAFSGGKDSQCIYRLAARRG